MRTNAVHVAPVAIQLVKVQKAAVRFSKADVAVLGKASGIQKESRRLSPTQPFGLLAHVGDQSRLYSILHDPFKRLRSGIDLVVVFAERKRCQFVKIVAQPWRPAWINS